MTAGAPRCGKRLAAAGLIFVVAGQAVVASEAPLPRPRPAASPSGVAEQSLAPASAGALPSSEVGHLPRPRPALQAAAAAAEPLPAAEPAQAPPNAGSDAESSATGASPASAAAAIDLLARTPRARPAGPPPNALALVDPRATVVGQEAPIAPPVPAALSGSDAACLQNLQALGVKFTAIPTIRPGEACEVARPLKVSSFGSGVAVAPAATLNCRTTEAVALWVRDVLLPQSRAQLGARPIAIAPGSTYDCRGRNRVAGAKLSEHATANAFDVMSIAFADRPPVEIAARNPALPEARFQAAIREGSCAYFTTVLGPGSDAAHHNHLHFDLAQRSGGYRLCSLGGSRVARGAKTNRE